jgi:outer membrane murein-binding lipoprotein Lpp
MRLVGQSILFAVAVTAGCVSRGSVELLEARLRDQEDELHRLQAQHRQVQSELTAARRLNEALKQKISPAGHEQAAWLTEQQFQIRGLKVHSLLTGGFDRDGQSGDDQVTLFFAPVDHRDQAIPAVGRLDCELLDPAQPLTRRQLGTWSFNEAQLRSAWQSTLGMSGYRLELPWQHPPQSAELQVRLRFHTPQGESFELSAPVRITLPESSLGAGRPAA